MKGRERTKRREESKVRKEREEKRDCRESNSAFTASLCQSKVSVC